MDQVINRNKVSIKCSFTCVNKQKKFPNWFLNSAPFDEGHACFRQSLRSFPMFLYECSVYGFINVQGCVELLCRPVALLHLAYKEGIMVDCISLSPSKCSKTYYLCPTSPVVLMHSDGAIFMQLICSLFIYAQAVHKIQTCLYKVRLPVPFLDTTVGFSAKDLA